MNEAPIMQRVDAPIVLTDLWLSNGMMLTVVERRASLLERLERAAEDGFLSVLYRTAMGKTFPASIAVRHIMMVGVETTYQEKPSQQMPQRIPVMVPHDPSVLNIGGKKQ